MAMMTAYGYRVMRARRQATPVRFRWLAVLNDAVNGNSDLHGLVRCPPLIQRWKSSSKRILDVGCGRADFHLEALLTRPYKGLVIGVDRDHAALKEALSLAITCDLDRQIRYVCASAEALPFREGVFDQLFLVDVLEHLPNDQKALAEARRILRRGGWLEISTPTPLYPVIFGRKIHTAVGHVRDGYRPEDLRRLLSAEGLEIRLLRGNTGILTWPWMAIWYRLAWLTLWNPKRQVMLVRMAAHGVLVAACLGARLTRWLDGFGGYCSNDVEARKTDA